MQLRANVRPSRGQLGAHTGIEVVETYYLTTYNIYVWLAEKANGVEHVPTGKRWTSPFLRSVM